ncbi:TetR/AcrR family transcriptional regulator [Pseudomonas sp. DWP3-1-2]|uniref:TetR/AcrR family transcriptional regulator n=1 Tax=Pseudomonas sp. DWP3-1-2 TaxID=2804645 RepID=UPI003CF32FE5
MNDTRQQLKDLVLRLKNANGKSVTVSALAEAAGVSRSTIYKYYPDVLTLLRGQHQTSTEVDSARDMNKIDLIRRQLSKNKELVAYLSNICSNQLIEIYELEETLDQVQKASNARLAYLESKIAKLESKKLRIVK